MKRVLQNSLLVVSAIILSLLTLEIGVRLLPPPLDGSSNPADVCSTVTGWRGKPTYQTTVATEDYVHDLRLNAVGMHDDDHPQAKPSDSYRILLLGDSFVQAVQVRHAETAHQRLEDALNQQATQPVEVISAGVGGWGTGQQLMYYRHEGRLYQPDLVLLMFYMGNDVKDNLPGRGVTVDGFNCYAPFFVLDETQLDPRPRYVAPGLADWAETESPSGRVIYNGLGRLYQTSRLYAHLEPLLSTPPPQASVLDFYREDTPLFDAGLRLTTALVEQLGHEVRQDDAAFGVVLITPLNLLEFAKATPAERAQVYQELPFMRRFETLDPPNLTLRDTFAADGTPVLDLFPMFHQQANQTGDNLFFREDKHWNAAGNRLAGESMAQWVMETYSP